MTGIAERIPGARCRELSGTPHRQIIGQPSLFADGPVDGRTVMVVGGAGAVAHHAIQPDEHEGTTVAATAGHRR
ncbi:hypothetical protein [Nocardia sp. NPDC051463]|uniref:hypothetical protein n=1 Tax=Nocardia sp. NPDC051463 TaxID=3154845 RepID=UPI00344C968E